MFTEIKINLIRWILCVFVRDNQLITQQSSAAVLPAFEKYESIRMLCAGLAVDAKVGNGT